MYEEVQLLPQELLPPELFRLLVEEVMMLSWQSLTQQESGFGVLITEGLGLIMLIIIAWGLIQIQMSTYQV